jgi:outer membrane protein assembly factor BamB
MRLAFLLIAVLPLSLPALTARAADSGELLYATEGNRLRRFDVDTLGQALPAQDVLVQRAGDGGEGGGGGSTPNGRDINGMICRLPDGSGRFVAGEDTGQPTPPAGWGIFAPDGTQVGKLTPTYRNQIDGPEPFGCAFDSQGRLFTTDLGDQGIGFGTGQLILWFPPYEGFPGPPGAYPETNAHSANFCKIAVDLGTATGIAIDAEDNVYVASSGLLRIEKFAPPFPTGLGPGQGCEATDSTGAPMASPVNRSIAVLGQLIVSPYSTFTGLAMAPNGNLYAASIIGGAIGEFRLDAPSPDLSDTLVRHIMLPGEPFPFPSTGTPQGLAVGGDGTLYYADLALVGTFPNVGPGPNGKVRRIRFDEDGDPLPPETLRTGLAFPDGVAVLPGHLPSKEWRTYAGSPSRLFHNTDEFILGPEGAGSLVQRWRFETGAIITASPTVARLDVPGEGPQQIAYIQSWDGRVYAVRVQDGSELWRFQTDPQAGANFPSTPSAHVERVAGRETVFIGSGHVFYALDALTGEEIWRFVAGTGCVDEMGNPPGDCVLGGERNEIESSAIVADGKVFFGMDVNDSVGGKGGFFALDAADGRMAWFFDLESGKTCRPLPGDEIRQFDAYHTAAELNLPADFLATRPGCDFPRSVNGCGNVWSSPSYDAGRHTLYVAASNCDTRTGAPGEDPRLPVPPMPPYDEAVFAIGTDGVPRWRWRAYAVDNDDFAYGASPNLFQIELPGHGLVDVLGVGQKDGHYRVLDRDGVNRLSGVDCTVAGPDGVLGCVDPGVGGPPVDPASFGSFPYWDTQVVPGGDAGGVILTASADEARRRIYFSTAPGFDPFAPQQPTLHFLHMDTGAVVWDSTSFVGTPFEIASTYASFAPTSSIPGVAFFGTLPGDLLRVLVTAADDPQDLFLYPLSGFPVSGGASAPAVVDGLVLLGHGIGVRGNPQDFGTITSNIPSALVALCVPGSAGCAACDNGQDDDRDGLLDMDDPGCHGPSDVSERPDCVDGIDNDHDGHDDWPADPGCRNRLPRASESPQCDDGRDNDGDGGVDFDPAQGPADAQCDAAWDETESGGPTGPACGLLGIELLPLLALLAAARRLRARRAARAVLLGGALLALLAPLPARALPVDVRVAASLSIRVGADPVFTSGDTAGIVQVDPTDGALALPAGLVSLSGTWSTASPVVSFTLTSSAAVLRPGGAALGTCPGPLGGRGACILGGAFGGGLGGSMPFSGTIRVGTLASLPASAIGAAATVSGGGLALQGAPFTARTAAVTTTAAGFWTTARGQAPASWFTRAGSSTALPAQVLLLIAPVHVNLSGQRLPVFAALSLRAIPEPGAGALTLVATGALLVWACWPMLRFRVLGRSSQR